MENQSFKKDLARESISENGQSNLLRSEIRREIESLEKLVSVRLLAIETAVQVAHDDLVRAPTDFQKQVTGLKELHEKWFLEKFSGVEALYIQKCAAIENLYDHKITAIENRFHERDIRVEQAAKDRKATVDGELAAQEKLSAQQSRFFVESVNKSEIATTKQIDQQGTLIKQIEKSVDEKFANTNSRITTIEGIAAGVITTKTAERADNGYGLLIAGIIISTVIGVAGIIISIMR